MTSENWTVYVHSQPKEFCSPYMKQPPWSSEMSMASQVTSEAGRLSLSFHRGLSGKCDESTVFKITCLPSLCMHEGKSVSNLPIVRGFSRVLPFPQPVKLTADVVSCAKPQQSINQSINLPYIWYLISNCFISYIYLYPLQWPDNTQASGTKVISQ